VGAGGDSTTMPVMVGLGGSFCVAGLGASTANVNIMLYGDSNGTCARTQEGYAIRTYNSIRT
jgi:hypothetical protein